MATGRKRQSSLLLQTKRAKARGILPLAFELTFLENHFRWHFLYLTNTLLPSDVSEQNYTFPASKIHNVVMLNLELVWVLLSFVIVLSKYWNRKKSTWNILPLENKGVWAFFVEKATFFVLEMSVSKRLHIWMAANIWSFFTRCWFLLWIVLSNIVMMAYPKSKEIF